MSYWDETDQYLSSHDHGPTCPRCRKEMFPADDHGRFVCSCNLGGGLDVVTGESFGTPAIPQVDASEMSDADKAQIDPIHRLDSTPTSAEQEVLNLILRGKIGTSEYATAQKKLQEEQNRARDNHDQNQGGE